MTKTEEFEILLTRWEDKIRREISIKRKVAVRVFSMNLQKDQTSRFVFENTRIDIDGMISGANISMLCIAHLFHADPVVHKLTDENYEWSNAVDDLLFKYYSGKISNEELITGINEVTEDHD